MLTKVLALISVLAILLSGVVGYFWGKTHKQNQILEELLDQHQQSLTSQDLRYQTALDSVALLEQQAEQLRIEHEQRTQALTGQLTLLQSNLVEIELTKKRTDEDLLNLASQLTSAKQMRCDVFANAQNPVMTDEILKKNEELITSLSQQIVEKNQLINRLNEDEQSISCLKRDLPRRLIDQLYGVRNQ